MTNDLLAAYQAVLDHSNTQLGALVMETQETFPDLTTEQKRAIITLRGGWLAHIARLQVEIEKLTDENPIH